ncbi:carbohydrate diacid transcriptional activator CdaR [Neobacillus bataviensis LMG 21833]|uniref:Carbohydrate diacid transcriptional activator CdaR n=1 Tax=Neobacillus bataviensis LMG 21833 TaxID=1117379 RepID=K6CVM0_9BACI|nr:sugar diacid recognition domain-containing protein [Neobacillus bataviensis]EKN64277.1 carbohydrate diacid transcriptional activator CdaR [Neobacillus bataviensis LMG 21833]
MVFLEDISQAIVENTTKIIGYPISITDEKGYIIGSNDVNRLGSFHKASIEVLKRKETICYEIEDVKDVENVLPGIATPIMMNNEPVGVLGIVGNPLEVKKYAQLVKSHVELMCHEYLKKEMRNLESKTLDNLLHYLLNSEKLDDPGQIIRYGKMLGYNLDSNVNRVCLLIEMDLLSDQFSEGQHQIPDKYSWQFLQNNIIDIFRYYLIDNKEDLLSLLTLDQFILIKTVDTAEPLDQYINRIKHNIDRTIQYLRTKYHFTIRIAMGSVKDGIKGIKGSYEDSLKALTAGKKTTITPEIYYYNDWNIILEVIGDELTPYITERLSEKMGKFFGHYNFNTLASTFMTYCRCNMNISETARILFLHRNSLVYRLEKISELTSLDITNFEHCLLLYFAIKKSGFKDKPLKTADHNEPIETIST